MTLRSRRIAATLTAALLGLLLAMLATSQAVYAQPPEPHKYIEEYNGPATCQMCHGDVATDVLHSVHYTWEGKLDHYNLVAGSTARINWLGVLNQKLDIPGGCGRCHVGDGSLPKPANELTTSDQAGIDCLICHSPTYETSLRFPVQDQAGAWTLTQDRTVLTARQAQRPTTQNCLQCHQNVGIASMGARGVDFAPVEDQHAGSGQTDVHLDAGMTCVDCHASERHRIMGFSPNLVSRDLPNQRLTCEGCHTAAPHTNALLNERHIRLDCRACHITSAGGLISRDWTAEPGYDPVTELYAPVDIVAAHDSAQPVFLWYNGQPVQEGQPWPGSRSDTTARLQPFKLFTATVPVDTATDQPIPLKLDVFYSEGKVDQAVKIGANAAEMDYSGSWQPKQITTTLQLSHGIASKAQARQCQDCHVPEGVVDFAALGYTADEVTQLISISSSSAGKRPSLQLAVVIPAAEPLPTPVNLSGDIEAARGFGIHIPWNPFLVLAISLAIIALGMYWLRRQRPPQP